MVELTSAEMFSGIGGFRLGLERSGWKCVWANDWNKYANKVYKKKFGKGELVEGDIREVDVESVPAHTLLTAGFPCQAFSVAGKRKGTKEARGTLFAHIARVASAKRPPLLLLENVKGLLSSESGRTFAIILRTLGNLGYLLEWQVLNSKHFGVPQNRERVFIVGHLRGAGTKQIFPIGEPDKVSAKDEEGGQRVASCLDRNYHKGARRQRQFVMQLVGDRDNPSASVKDEAFCLPSNPMSDRQQVVLLPAVKHKLPFMGTAPKPKNIMTEPSFPLQTSGGYDLAILKGKTTRQAEFDGDKDIYAGYAGIRRLTPTECERLQGFPDGWTEGVSDTQRYKLLGNAVTVNVVEFLGKKLRECLA